MTHRRTAGSLGRSDAGIALGLGILAVAYLSQWPQNLGRSDEALFLYHARLVFEGAVPYRDFFDFHTPLASYAMAAAFALGGTTLATAKLATAGVHGLTVALVFVAGRRFGGDARLCAALALAFLALGPPSWPHASPHWIATPLVVGLAAIVARPALSGPALVGLGLVTGAVASMQQQTGAPFALGLAAILVFDSALAQDTGTAARSAGLRLTVYATATGAVVFVVLGYHAIHAGVPRIFEQIVVHPLTGYRELNRVPWGSVDDWTVERARYTLPWLLASLPIALTALAGLRGVAAWRAGDRDAGRRAAAVTALSLAGIASIANRPDFIHLAFVLPLYLVLAGEALAWGIGLLPPAARSATTIALALAIAASSISRMNTNLARAHAEFDQPAATRFGHVDFADAWEPELFADVDAALADNAERVFFVYPVMPSLYLTTESRNPTLHEILLPGYKSPEHYAEVLATLEADPPGHLVLVRPLIGDASDPVRAWVETRYACADDRVPCWLHRLR